MDRKVICVEDGPCYTFGNGMLAVGITRTDLLVDNNFKFAIGNESSASRWWLYQGYRALALRNPNLCFVPEPSVAREREITRGTQAPPQKYFVKPLDHEQISKLNSADLCEYPFWEDYCEAWGWTARKPYWKRADDTYYKQYYRRKNIARFPETQIGHPARRARVDPFPAGPDSGGLGLLGLEGTPKNEDFRARRPFFEMPLSYTRRLARLENLKPCKTPVEFNNRRH